MREILIESIPNQEETTHIRIAVQTHRCEEFNLSRQSLSERTFVHMGFELKSYHGPQVIPSSSHPGLYVRGDDHSRDDDLLEVPSQEWLRKCEAAITAYNIYHANCDLCKERHCNQCKNKK